MALPTTHQRMSATEFLRLPQGPPYFQLIEGELYMSPSPSRRHQQIIVALSSLIWTHLQQHPQGTVLVAPSDVHLGPDDVYEPDLYFVSRERASILADHGTNGAPDLVVEVLSPSIARLDLEAKRRAYAAAGVKELWIVSPERGTLQQFDFSRSADTPARSCAPGETLTTPILPGLGLSLVAVFKG